MLGKMMDTLIIVGGDSISHKQKKYFSFADITKSEPKA